MRKKVDNIYIKYTIYSAYTISALKETLNQKCLTMNFIKEYANLTFVFLQAKNQVEIAVNVSCNYFFFQLTILKI